MPRACQGVRSCAKKKPPHRPREPNSVRGRIEALVSEHGPASADDIAPMASDIPRAQIAATLAGLCQIGRLEMVKRGHGLGRGRGSTPSVYAIATQKPKPKPARRPVVASVFDLGKHVAL